MISFSLGVKKGGRSGKIDEAHALSKQDLSRRMSPLHVMSMAEDPEVDEPATPVPSAEDRQGQPVGTRPLAAL